MFIPHILLKMTGDGRTILLLKYVRNNRRKVNTLKLCKRIYGIKLVLGTYIIVVGCSEVLSAVNFRRSYM